MNSKGKVTVKKGFKGKAVITIQAEATERYKAVKKKVTVIVGPKATAPTSVKVDGKDLVVTWDRNATATGYKIQYSKDKNFSKNVKSKTLGQVKKGKKGSYTAKDLKKGTYYVRMRAVNGSSYSRWSKTRRVKIK